MKAASTTQAVIALSSGESEFYAIVRAWPRCSDSAAWRKTTVSTCGSVWGQTPLPGGSERGRLYGRRPVAVGAGSVPPGRGDDQEDCWSVERGRPRDEVFGRAQNPGRNGVDGVRRRRRAKRFGTLRGFVGPARGSDLGRLESSGAHSAATVRIRPALPRRCVADQRIHRHVLHVGGCGCETNRSLFGCRCM